jgi:hypothetical protein
MKQGDNGLRADQETFIALAYVLEDENGCCREFGTFNVYGVAPKQIGELRSIRRGKAHAIIPVVSEKPADGAITKTAVTVKDDEQVAGDLESTIHLSLRMIGSALGTRVDLGVMKGVFPLGIDGSFLASAKDRCIVLLRHREGGPGLPVCSLVDQGASIAKLFLDLTGSKGARTPKSVPMGPCGIMGSTHASGFNQSIKTPRTKVKPENTVPRVIRVRPNEYLAAYVAVADRVDQMLAPLHGLFHVQGRKGRTCGCDPSPS